MYANKCSISKNIHSNDGRAIVTDIAEAFAFDDEPTSSFTTPSLRFEMMLLTFAQMKANTPCVVVVTASPAIFRESNAPCSFATSIAVVACS